MKADDQLTQTSPPYEYITEIRQWWIPTPFTEQTTVFQDLQQDFQVSNAELSVDLHVPNVSLERIHAPPVVHNDPAITEFIPGEERCLKFINQDLTFLQESHIPSTFTNVSHTPTPLKESSHITLPTRTSKENNQTVCTQTAELIDQGLGGHLVVLQRTPAIVFQVGVQPIEMLFLLCATSLLISLPLV